MQPVPGMETRSRAGPRCSSLDPGFLEARESGHLGFMLILRLREKPALESYCKSGNFEDGSSHLLHANPSIGARQMLLLLTPLPLTEC